jgi:hypothetical protein
LGGVHAFDSILIVERLMYVKSETCRANEAESVDGRRVDGSSVVTFTRCRHEIVDEASIRRSLDLHQLLAEAGA